MFSLVKFSVVMVIERSSSVTGINSMTVRGWVTLETCLFTITLTLTLQAAGLNKEQNNWDKIDDFNWLASKDPSPNWTILSQDKRTNFT